MNAPAPLLDLQDWVLDEIDDLGRRRAAVLALVVAVGVVLIVVGGPAGSPPAVAGTLILAAVGCTILAAIIRKVSR